MFNQIIMSNKFDLNLSTTLSSYWCTAKFQEIPLPALRFEKVEETDTQKWKSENNTPKRNDAQRRSTKPRNPKRKTTLTTLKEKQIHSQENDTQSRLKNASRTEEFAIREIKLPQRKKNGRH